MTLPAAFLSMPIAHRGLHNALQNRPENSLSAVRAAIAHGYGIEIDVQLTADDQAIVFHDYSLDRLTDANGPVRGQSLRQLGEMRLSGSSETIPSLAQVLETVNGQVPVLIEIKDQDGALGPAVGPLEHAVSAALQAYSGPVAVMSFNPHAVALMANLCPSVPRGLVTCAFAASDWPIPTHVSERLRDVPDYDAVGVCFISHDHKDLNRDRVQDLKSTGAAVLTWTIKTSEQEKQARKIADNITFEGYLPEICS